MAKDMVTAVNAAAAEMRATFGKIVASSLKSIPAPLHDEARRLAAVRDVQTPALALQAFKAMAKDGYPLRDAALLGKKPKALRGQMRGPMDPAYAITAKGVGGDVMQAWQSLVTAYAAIVASGADPGVSADVLAALREG